MYNLNIHGGAVMREVLRTPEERFVDLPGFLYDPRYIGGLKGFEGSRMHYVDEDPEDVDHIFLCLHGEPTWSYLYRKMIPVFMTAGHRAEVEHFKIMRPVLEIDLPSRRLGTEAREKNGVKSFS